MAMNGTGARNRVVVLCSRLDRIEGVLEDAGGDVSWLVLSETRESRSIAAYLRSQPGLQEMDVAGLRRSRRETFRKQYIQLFSHLSQQNSSLTWWSLPPATKDPYSTALCSDMAGFLLIVELFRQGHEKLLVVTDSQNLAAQVKSWTTDEGIKLVILMNRKGLWRSWVKRHTPAGVIQALIIIVYRWLQCRRGFSIRHLEEDRILLVSQVYASSFPSDRAGAYRDAYFGPLVKHLEDTGRNALVMVLTRGHFRGLLSQIKELRTRVPVVPVEAFLTPLDITWCSLRAMWVSLKGVTVKGDLRVSGVDVGVLIRRTFSEASGSGNPFMNFRVYRAVLGMARKVSIERCLYPHENRTWEKMVLLAMRKACPQVRIAGYQHASIPPSHLQFFLGEGEASVLPLPDALLTSGSVTEDLLAREGGYPAGFLHSGCALRHQIPPANALNFDSTNHASRLLVALGFGFEQYVKTLEFLEKTFDRNSGHQIVIRTHPNMPLPPDQVLKAGNITGNNTYSQSLGDLQEAISEADVVLYASSTVAFEAACAGKPTIWLDLGTYLDTDPMGGWNEFKWRAEGPEALRDALAEIDRLPREKLEALSLKAQNYGRAYLAPVDEEGIRSFLTA